MGGHNSRHYDRRRLWALRRDGDTEDEIAIPDESPQSKFSPDRLALFLTRLALYFVVLVAGFFSLGLTAMSLFFIGWDGKKLLPLALFCLCVAVFAGWLTGKLTPKASTASQDSRDTR